MTTDSTGIPADALRLDWDDVCKQSLQLAEMIEEHHRKTGEQFDVLVVVPRGSYYPANIVSRRLGFSGTDLLHACIGSYEAGARQRSESFRLGQMPPKEMVKGKDVLVIEEVCDTGQTLKFLTDWLREAGAGIVRTGVLHYKPDKSQTDFVPDWYVGRTDKWIVYPWEGYEARGRDSLVHRKPA